MTSDRTKHENEMRIVNTEIGIVVPTRGTRPLYLEQCIRSIRSNGDVHICLVGPDTLEIQPFRAMCDSFVSDSGRGLAAAINAGIASLPPSVKFVNWLGDDDVVNTDGLEKLHASLTSKKNVVLAYGYCQYINSAGSTLFTIRADRWAEKLLHFGPQLISQPAVLFRRDSFEQVGGLDEALQWAFDLDLFIKFSRVGPFLGVSAPTAGYRWHHAALTVGLRGDSVREASLVRRRNLPPLLRRLAWIWEPFVRWLILLGGWVVSRRATA
jgi:GT2 family glycosyltransferase